MRMRRGRRWGPTWASAAAKYRRAAGAGFPASTNETALGELQLILWRGTVSRPGSARRAAGGAAVEQQETFVLTPGTVGAITASTGDDWLWRGSDGTGYDAQAFAARCLALLEEDAAAA